MLRNGAVLGENEALVAAAIIAAEATLAEDGFRQRDVRFYFELFSNWLESTTGAWTLDLHNAQIQRYLDQLVRAGGAKRPRRTPPRYQLTPDGLLSLLHTLTARHSLKRLDEFFLVFHILRAYGGRLRALTQKNGPLPSRALSLRVDELVDARAFVQREIAAVERELGRLSLRIEESHKTAELTRQLIAKGKPIEQVVSAVEQEFPYELNSRKPLSELLTQLPPAFRVPELSDIAAQRADDLWRPTLALLSAYLEILRGLLEGERRAR
jgi:hypothetical protein